MEDVAEDVVVAVAMAAKDEPLPAEPLPVPEDDSPLQENT